MNDDPLEPTPDWMSRILDEERVRVDDDPAMRDAVLRHVESVVGPLPPDGGGGGGAEGSGGGGGTGASPGEGAPGAAAGTGAAAGAGSVAAKVFSLKAVAGIAALAFATGTATGVGLSGRTDAARPLVTTTTTPPPASSGPAPSAPTSSSLAAVDVASLPPVASGTSATLPVSAPVPATATATTTPPATAADLSRERELVDLARAALAKQNPTLALETVARHEAAFPNGKLREERDALRVQALARAGRRPEAEAAAARFHRAYPSSLLGAVVDAALASH